MIYMLYSLLDTTYNKGIAFTGLMLGFLLTCFLLKVLQNVLPRDGGRAFAVNGVLSQGKPRGAGIVFILVFAVLAVLFTPTGEGNDKRELLIYLIMICGAMISGYLDDSAKTPWGEYKKGLIDLVIAFVTSLTFINFNSTTFTIMITGNAITLPAAVFVILGMILVWASINVTNCTDGVDGLSGSISIASLITFYIIFNSKLNNASYAHLTLLMSVCILGYLWFNASPSKLLMGDAGSRAIGLFIAIVALKTGSPLLYLPIAAVFIIDGGTGLIKVFLIRFFKINLFKNTRTPIHDHVRKNMGWSDTQTVFRFLIIQVAISFIILYFIL